MRHRGGGGGSVGGVGNRFKRMHMNVCCKLSDVRCIRTNGGQRQMDGSVVE